MPSALYVFSKEKHLKKKKTHPGSTKAINFLWGDTYRERACIKVLGMGLAAMNFSFLLTISAHSAVNDSAPVQKGICFSFLRFHTISLVTVAWKALK